MAGVGTEMFYVEGHLFTGHRNDRMLSVENSGNNLLVVVVLLLLLLYFKLHSVSSCFGKLGWGGELLKAVGWGQVIAGLLYPVRCLDP